MRGAHNGFDVALGEVGGHCDHALVYVTTEGLLGIASEAAQQCDGEGNGVELRLIGLAKFVRNFKQGAVIGPLHREGAPRDAVHFLEGGALKLQEAREGVQRIWNELRKISNVNGGNRKIEKFCEGFCGLTVTLSLVRSKKKKKKAVTRKRTIAHVTNGILSDKTMPAAEGDDSPTQSQTTGKACAAYGVA